MKKSIIVLILACIILVAFAAALQAQTLPVDTRKKEMQYSKSFTAFRYIPAADTLWHRITLPARCIEVVALADTGAVAIAPDSIYTSTNTHIFRLGAGIPLKLPTYKATVLYVRRAVSTIATKVSFLFYRM